jgi:glycosyltransferase
MTVKVSIITAAYNNSKTISQCIKSISEQTYKNIEHIIVAGPSYDTTDEEISINLNKNIRLISEKKHGLYQALNEGILQSTGDIIGFVHADDFLSKKDAIEKIVASFTNTCSIATYSDLDIISKKYSNKVVRRWVAGKFSSQNLRKGWMPPHPTLYVRKSYLKNNSFNTRYKISSDYDFILKLFGQNQGKINYIPETLYKMRLGGVSSTKLFSKMIEDFHIIRSNNIGGIQTLYLKNFSKISQFFV